MAIETKIEGDLESIQSGVDWLRGTFGSAVADAAADAARAGADSAHDWIGDTGDAFRAEAAQLRDQADLLAGGVHVAADGFERYADALRAALRKVDDIRGDAAAAGLELTVTQILPPDPTAPTKKAAGHAADALMDEYRRKQEAFKAAAEDVDRVKGDLWTAVQELTDAGSKLKDMTDRIDPSQVRESKLLDVFRRGGRAFGWAGTAVTGLDIALMAMEGKRPGNIAARAAGEELGGWAELISNHPHAAGLLRSAGVDPDEHDFGELGGDYAEKWYRELPPDWRRNIDAGLTAPVTGPEALANVISDEIEENGLPSGFGTPLPAERDAFQEMVHQGLQGVGDAHDAVEGGVDAYHEAQDLAELGREKLDDAAEGLKPLVPSWP